MSAAVVHAFDQPPRCEDVPVPVAADPDDLVVDVLAVGLHPRVRSQANGSHYTSTDELPLVPGIDGVGRTPDDELRYFVLPDTPHGSLAERVLIDRRRSIVLPPGTDPVAVAAAINPAMSSWLALRRRIGFPPGARVLVLGATGNAGRLAVQVATHLGAGHVTAAGRDPERLAAVGADRWATLDDLADAGTEVDVVLDYVWGAPTLQALGQIVPNRRDDGQELTWVQIGSVAGPDLELPSAALRAIRLTLVGSGQGSVPTGDILAELPALAAEISAGTFAVDARAVPLADVEAAWGEADARERIVVTP